MKKIFLYILTVVASFIVYTIGFTVYENIKVNNMVQKFIASSTKYKTIEVDKTTKRIYYSVPRETYADDTSVFYDYDKGQIGGVGDVLVTKDSPFKGVFFIHPFITFYFGGHSAILDENNEITEAVGFPDGNMNILDVILHTGSSTDDHYSVQVSTGINNYWGDADYYSKETDSYELYGGYYRDEYIALRAKASLAERKRASDNAKNIANAKSLYNFTFFLNTKDKYYCTDLISRSYENTYNNEGIENDLNHDKFITSVNDIILSPDVYISAYFKVEFDSENNATEHLYHLAEPL